MQELHWVPEGRKRKGRPRKNWIVRDRQERLERPGNIMGKGGGTGN